MQDQIHPRLTIGSFVWQERKVKPALSAIYPKNGYQGKIIILSASNYMDNSLAIPVKASS